MPNPLQTTEAPPPVPNPGAGMGNNPLQPGSGPVGQAAAMMAQPAPTRDMAIAALTHFAAIKSKLDQVLADPDLGKRDMKGSIRDHILDLVSDRIFSAPTAVARLTSVPDGTKPGGPLEQRRWVESHDAQTRQARDMILEHYRQSNPQDMNEPVRYSRDRHLHHMDSLMAHYQGLKRA